MATGTAVVNAGTVVTRRTDSLVMGREATHHAAVVISSFNSLDVTRFAGITRPALRCEVHG